MSSTSQLTAGQECQQAAKLLSGFIDQNPPNGAIPPVFFRSCMAVAICKGPIGVAVVRLPSLDWSAPCAIGLVSREYNAGNRGSNNEDPAIKSGQETVLLFMTEKAVFSLVRRTQLSLSVSHTFKAGPLIYSGTAPPGTEPPIVDSAIDVYTYVRYNGGPTPPSLVQQYMSGWSVWEDPLRHGRWHGNDVTWFDVLTNRISVDRSSVGNALYVVMALAAGSSGGSLPSGSGSASLPFAHVDKITNAPSFKDKTPNSRPPPPSKASKPAGLKSTVSKAASNPGQYAPLSNLQTTIAQQQQPQQQQMPQQQQTSQQQLSQQQQIQMQQMQQQQQQQWQQPQQQQWQGTMQPNMGFNNSNGAYQNGYEQQNAMAQQQQQQVQMQHQQIHMRLVELNNMQQQLQVQIQNLLQSPQTAAQAYPYQQELLLVQQQINQLLQLKQQLPQM